ncbi:peptidoglycan-recognition protein LE isoform X2 [Anabrus simplex]|uniref:peptidoglycan-recognition protein LE isoform X2 n=1 Tax=Anabrus simplex TaxID=316456 RepID=UPI0035A363ED
MIFTKEQQQGSASGALKDVPLGQSVQISGMDTPLTDDITWKGNTWSRKSTRIGVLGIVIICILLSAVVALAVLLYESRNDHPIRAVSISEGVHYVPSAELMRSSNDAYSGYTTTKEIPTSVSSKNKEIEEAIMEKMSSERQVMPTTSSNEHEEPSTAIPNTLEHKDTSAEITIKPDNQESTSSSEHEGTSTESPQQMVFQELLKEELEAVKDLATPMNISSNDTMTAAVITVIELELDFSNDTDYDELSEIDCGGTSEIIFGEELELGYGKTSEMEYDNYDDEGERMLNDSDDSTLLQNDLKMVPKSEWGGVPPTSINLRLEPSPYVVITQTGTGPGFDQDSCSETMKFIQMSSMEEEGLPDMCDNYYICGDGKVYIGRGPNVTNCHIGFVRFKNIGISFIGDFQKYAPTAVQVKALESLLSVGISQHFLNPDYKIIAHKEINLPYSLFMGPGKYLLDEINSMPHRCSSSCIDDIDYSDYDYDSSDFGINFMRSLG